MRATHASVVQDISCDALVTVGKSLSWIEDNPMKDWDLAPTNSCHRVKLYTRCEMKSDRANFRVQHCCGQLTPSNAAILGVCPRKPGYPLEHLPSLPWPRCPATSG